MPSRERLTRRAFPSSGLESGMGLDATIRSAVALANRVTASLQVSVSHAPWTGPGADGTGAWGTATARQAIVDDSYRQHRLPTGEIVSCAAKLTFVQPIDANGATGRREPLDPRDVFTLPNGHTGPVVDIPSGPLDPTTGRPYFGAVVLG